MGRTQDGRARINWPFVTGGVAITASSGGVALAIGAVASALGQPFDKVMLLFAVLGGVLLFVYFTVLTSVVTPRMEHRVRQLGGKPNLGRAGDAEKSTGDVVRFSFLVLFVGLGFLVGGVVGIAV